MKYEDIENVNKELKTIDIKGKDYVDVAQRIKAFRKLYPEGTIETEIVKMEDGVVTFKSTIKNGDLVLATGHAQEKESSSFINKTSFVENCETSAIGRAIGMIGIGETSIASLEEVANAINNQNKSRNEINIEAKLGFGTKHKDHTWVQVYFADPQYFDWLIENAKDEEGAKIYKTIHDTIEANEERIKKEKGIE